MAAYNQTVQYAYTCFVGFSVVVPLIALFGIVGNIISVIVLQKYRLFRSMFRLFLIGLACADVGILMSLGACLVIQGITCRSHFFRNDWSLETWQMLLAAQFVLFHISNLFLPVSYMTLSALTVDRYIAIVKEDITRKFSTAKNARIVLVVIWVIGALFFVLAVMKRTQCEDCGLRVLDLLNGTLGVFDLPNGTDESDRFLGFEPQAKEWLSVSSSVATATVLTVIVCVCFAVNLSVILRVRKSTKTFEHKDKSSVLLCVILGVLGVCALPTLIYRFTWPLAGHSLELDFIRVLSGVFAIVNSSVNFIVYMLIGRQFREALKKLFGM